MAFLIFFMFRVVFLFVPVSSVFLFAVFAAIDLFFGIRQDENLIELLFYGSDTAGILAFDDVYDLFWWFQLSFFDDLFIFDDVDRDVMIDESYNVQIECIDGAFHLDDVFFAHLVAFGVFDDRDLVVCLVELQIVIDRHGFSGFDMVEDVSFVKSTYIQHGSSTSNSVRIRAIRTYTPYCACLK